MAFDPLYAVGPGRPVNLRDIDPSIVGRQLSQSYDGLPAAPEAAVGSQTPEPSLYQPTTGDRLTGAVASFGANTDPNSVYAPEQFFGSAARGFAGVKTYLNNLRQQHAEGQRQAQQDDLNRRKGEQAILTDKAQERYYDAGAQQRMTPQSPGLPEVRSTDHGPIEQQPDGSWRYIQPQGRPVTKPPKPPANAVLKTDENGLQWWADPRTHNLTPAMKPDGSQMRALGRRQGGITPRTPTTPTPKVLSQGDYDILKSDGMTDQEMTDAGYTLP